MGTVKISGKACTVKSVTCFDFWPQVKLRSTIPSSPQVMNTFCWLVKLIMFFNFMQSFNRLNLLQLVSFFFQQWSIRFHHLTWEKWAQASAANLSRSLLQPCRWDRRNISTRETNNDTCPGRDMADAKATENFSSQYRKRKFRTLTRSPKYILTNTFIIKYI